MEEAPCGSYGAKCVLRDVGQRLSRRHTIWKSIAESGKFPR